MVRKVLLIYVWLGLIITLPVLPVDNNPAYSKYDYSDARVNGSDQPDVEYYEEEIYSDEETYSDEPYSNEEYGCTELPNGQKVCIDEDGKEYISGKPDGWSEMNCQLDTTTNTEHCFHEGITLECFREEGMLECQL